MLRRRNPGFTLVEVLVATGLVSVVLALAIKGFTESKKIADLTKAKIVASDEARLGVQKIVQLLNRCHVIFFDARPLGQIAANPANLGAVAFQGVPASLTSLAPTGNVKMAQTNNANFTAPLNTGLQTLARASFRVVDIDESTPTAANPGSPTKQGQRLRTGEDLGTPPASWTRFDKYISSPLAYFAEAVFPTTSGGTQVNANYPVNWNIYLVYVAPMRFDSPDDDNDALFPQQSGTRDKGPGGWSRATVPYEIRLLTIPNVCALRPDVIGTWNNPVPAGRPLNPPGVVGGRRADNVGVLPYPYDVQARGVNFDPLPIQMDEAATRLSPSNPYYGASSLGRVNPGGSGNATVHGNWGNIGNDPPNEAALNQRGVWKATGDGYAAATPATDIVIARYVDPDAVHGTFIRLANDQNLVNPGETAPRPWINAYGGPQRFNPAWWNGANAGIAVLPPKRAMVSVATRYRLSRQNPFSFGVDQAEVDLTTLVRYQQLTYRRDR